jgi:adenosylmethionine-8-amino-7-oxononanoate aminotransferase
MPDIHPLLRSPFPTSVFVTGTGTDVGKTLCSAVLCALWEADYWKPVQSGVQSQDAWELLRLSPVTPIHLSTIVLQEPASPHLSARLEGVELTVAEIVEHRPEAWCLVVEGAGGALVPLSETEDLTHLCTALQLPVIVVASTELGTIHHSLATLLALRERGCPVAGVLLNGPAHGENARQIRDRGQVQILGRIPPLYPLDAQAVAQLVQDWKDGRWVDPCEEATPVREAGPTGGSLGERDQSVIWHPYTQHKTVASPLEVTRAHGACLHTEDRGEVVDAISSWWVCNHGHAHPKIAQAIGRQAKQLEQVIFAGCTHQPAVELAERLLPQLPGHPSRLFFSDNGSTAVEVALKACVQMAVRAGVQRPRIGALVDAYHGDTFGAMAVGERSIFSAPFDSLLFEVDRLPTPAGPWSPESEEARIAVQTSLQAVQAWLKQQQGNIACLIVEPRIQGSSGMRMYPRSWLEGVDQLCRDAGVPWIADEVFTGFGRTGRLFACTERDGERALTPSAICLSKGLTGGFLPMGVTAFREEIFEDFLAEDRSRAFFHGHSFTANPLGCAAALASLDLSLDPGTARSWERIESWHRAGLETLARDHGISGARVLGTIAAFELPDSAGGYLASRGQAIVRIALEHGVLLRPLGDTIYIVPPYCMRRSEHDRIMDALDLALAEVCPR